jgi:hypothetical protein
MGEPYLNIERYNLVDGKYEFGVTEKFLVAYLAGLAWIPKEEYMPFIENAEIGEMILLKDMIAIVRLKYPAIPGINPNENICCDYGDDD